MPFISDELIEKTWQRIGGFDGNEIRKLQKRHRKTQNALTMFVYSLLDEFREDAFGVLIYVFHVVVEAFENAKPRPKRASKGLIDSLSKEKETDAPIPITLAIECSPEPYALEYVYEAFTEDDDVVLSKHELEAFLVALVIVIECLHRACLRS